MQNSVGAALKLLLQTSQVTVRKFENKFLFTERVCAILSYPGLYTKTCLCTACVSGKKKRPGKWGKTLSQQERLQSEQRTLTVLHTLQPLSTAEGQTQTRTLRENTLQIFKLYVAKTRIWERITKPVVVSWYVVKDIKVKLPIKRVSTAKRVCVCVQWVTEKQSQTNHWLNTTKSKATDH